MSSWVSYPTGYPAAAAAYHAAYYKGFGMGGPPPPTQRLTLPIKRTRMPPANAPSNIKRNKPNPNIKLGMANKSVPVLTTITTTDVGTNNTPKPTGDDDILICGNCRETFTALTELLEHKKTPCKLRFPCRCEEYEAARSSRAPGEPDGIMCAICKQVCSSSWQLLQHTQRNHNVVVFEMPSDSSNHKARDDENQGENSGTKKLPAR